MTLDRAFVRDVKALSRECSSEAKLKNLQKVVTRKFLLPANKFQKKKGADGHAAAPFHCTINQQIF